MTDDNVGLQFRDGNLGVAEVDPNYRNPGPACNPDVRAGIADHDRSGNVSPARAMVWRRMVGSGLATPNVSAPQIAQALRHIQFGEQELRKPLQLVGADGEPETASLQFVEGCVETSNGLEASAI